MNARKRRDTRSGTDFDESAHRSTSPTSRSANRAQSLYSSTSQHQGGKKRRKAPTPLHVERRNTHSEDVQDSESSSGESHQPTKTRTEAREGSMAWKPNRVSKTNKDRSGRTRLARACATGVADEVEKWLDERLDDIDVADFAGNTPLQVASLEGHAEIVKLLLAAGCATDSRNVDGDTPLIDAVENGHLEVVRMLLDAGVDPMQRSQNGKEPAELVNPDMDDAEEIRAALLASKKDRDGRRRQSEDHSRSKMSAPRELEISSVANSGPSPTHSTRSPPLEPGTKRRTARSQHTDDNLLWVNPTPQRLRDAAGKGDIKIVNHILGMNPRADTDAILAAAQGGHDEVLGLMLAMGDPEPDPSPLRSGNLKPGYTTPMLAAIGGGNLKVLDLLLHQPGFDPTRKMHKNLTYFELAKERQGSGWEEEFELLKDAHEQFKKNGGRRSNHTSPNKLRSKRTESRKSSPEPSSSPHEVRKIRRSHLVKEESDDHLNPATKRRPSYQGTASRRPEEVRKLTSIASDPGSPKNTKARDMKSIHRHRSNSPSQPLPKQRRRLMSGNEVKTDQDSRKNKTHTSDDKERRKSGDSVNSHEARPRKSSETSIMSAPPGKKASSESPQRTKEELGRKRHRTSVSPQASRSEATDALKKKKRQRVDSQGSGIDKTTGVGGSPGEKALEGNRDRSSRLGPAPAANMLPTPSSKASPKPSHAPTPAAPVAFMGNTTLISTIDNAAKESPSAINAKSRPSSPFSGVKGMENDVTMQNEHVVQAIDEEEEKKRQEEEERLQQQERLAEQEVARKAAEERQKAEAEIQAQLQKEREDAERQAQIERKKEEELERQLQEEQRRQREELEAQAKKRREEEMQKRRAEQERQRKIDQEKRRREAEQREIAARFKAQQEEEAARRASLPNGLRRYFELTAEQARSVSEIRRWLPLRTVTTLDLDDRAEGLGTSDRWIANVQAAPLLANKDLELSQCTLSPS